jgi:RimJ/RimL family protein N-acetyltransferase
MRAIEVERLGRQVMQTTTCYDESRTTELVRPNPTNLSAALDWRSGVPILTAGGMSLRELRRSDASSLVSMLNATEVARFMSTPPATAEGFERFIAWSQRERTEGRHVCFAVVRDGIDYPIGLIQIRQLTPDFSTAEWGFAIGRRFWGTGAFESAARLAIEFSFETLGVVRLEARAAISNGRGNGALAKVGAIREGVLHRSFLKDGHYVDQAIWSIVRDEWRQTKAVWGSMIH